MQGLLDRAGFSGDSRSLLVKSRQLFLFERKHELRLLQLGLQPLDVVLMPALFLFALFLGRGSIMFQRVTRVLVLSFQRRPVPLGVAVALERLQPQRRSAKSRRWRDLSTFFIVKPGYAAFPKVKMRCRGSTSSSGLSASGL